MALALCRGLAHVEARGLEHVPASGPVVLAANHRAFMDGIVLLAYVPRPTACLGKAEAFIGPLGWLLRRCGQIPVRRGVVDPVSVRTSARLLRGGGALGVFPEGTRGDGAVRTAAPGAAYFALRSGAAVVPVALHGTPAMLRRRTLRRPRVVLTVAAGMPFAQWPDREILPRRTVRADAERIRACLAGLVANTRDGHE